jgi:hypothetical protein
MHGDDFICILGINSLAKKNQIDHNLTFINLN